MYIINTIPHGKCFVRYLRTRFCIRNLTRSLRSLVRFLIRQQLERKYRTPALSMKYSLYMWYMSVRGTHITREHISLSCLSETRQRRQSWKFLPLNFIFMTLVDICRHFENMVLFKNHWPQTVGWGPDRGYSIWEEGIGLTFDVVKSSPKRQRTEMFFEDVLQGFAYKQYYRALKFQ